MKKLISLLLAIAFILVLTGCKDSNEDVNSAFFDSVTETQQTESTDNSQESEQANSEITDVSSTTDSGSETEETPKQKIYTYSDSTKTQAYIFKKQSNSTDAYFVQASDLSNAKCECMYEDEDIKTQVFTIDEDDTLTCPCGKTVITKDYLVSVE